MSAFRSRFLKEIWKWTVAFLLTVIIPLQRLYYFDQELATHLRRHPRPHKVNIFNWKIELTLSACPCVRPLQCKLRAILMNRATRSSYRTLFISRKEPDLTDMSYTYHTKIRFKFRLEVYKNFKPTDNVCKKMEHHQQASRYSHFRRSLCLLFRPYEILDSKNYKF